MSIEHLGPEPVPATYADLQSFLTEAAANFGVTETNEQGQLAWTGAQAGRLIMAGSQQYGGHEQLGITVVGPNSLITEIFRPDFSAPLAHRPDELHFRVEPEAAPQDRQAWLMADVASDRLLANNRYSFGQLLDVFQNIGTEFGAPRRFWRTWLGVLAIADTTLIERARHGNPFRHF